MSNKRHANERNNISILVVRLGHDCMRVLQFIYRVNAGRGLVRIYGFTMELLSGETALFVLLIKYYLRNPLALSFYCYHYIEHYIIITINAYAPCIQDGYFKNEYGCFILSKNFDDVFGNIVG